MRGEEGGHREKALLAAFMHALQKNSTARLNDTPLVMLTKSNWEKLTGVCMGDEAEAGKD